MKKLVNNNDWHILKGPAVTLQNQLNRMSERYDIKVHTANIATNGDAVIVVERMKKDSQTLMEEIHGVN